ncbi:MAG: hypothetical protein IJT23_04625 [Clostridia bacterium]|nr:hypothetical protein [Clostridia bacterium]
MKDMYIKPRIEVITFEAEDILTASVATDMNLYGGIDGANIQKIDVGDSDQWESYTD